MSVLWLILAYLASSLPPTFGLPLTFGLSWVFFKVTDRRNLAKVHRP